MDTLFRLLAKMLAGVLEKYADPKLQKTLDKFNAGVEAEDRLAKDAAAKSEASRAAYTESITQRQMWDDLNAKAQIGIAESEQRFNAAQDRIKSRDAETEKLNKAVLDRTDADAFGGGVPKSKA